MLITIINTTLVAGGRSLSFKGGVARVCGVRVLGAIRYSIPIYLAVGAAPQRRRG